MIVEKEGGRPADTGSRYGIAGASGKGGVSRGVDEEVRYRGRDADGGATA
jgi:hypothetical protein